MYPWMQLYSGWFTRYLYNICTCETYKQMAKKKTTTKTMKTKQAIKTTRTINHEQTEMTNKHFGLNRETAMKYSKREGYQMSKYT